MLGCFVIIQGISGDIGVMDGIICRYIAVPSNFNWSPHGWRRLCRIVAVVIVVSGGVGGVVGGVVSGVVGVRRVVHHKHVGVDVGCRARGAVGEVGSRFVFVRNITPRATIPFIV